jgi:hypothetical protein
MILFEGGFTFTNFVADVFAVFMFILWFWLPARVSSGVRSTRNCRCDA